MTGAGRIATEPDQVGELPGSGHNRPCYAPGADLSGGVERHECDPGQIAGRPVAHGAQYGEGQRVLPGRACHRSAFQIDRDGAGARVQSSLGCCGRDDTAAAIQNS